MTRLRFVCTLLAVTMLVLAAPASALAQDDALALKPAEPDFTLIGLPTSLRVPTLKGAFRVTHRFGRPLNDNFGDVASDLFGLDSGALIGLEYRFGLFANTQVGIHRTNLGKTVEFFAQYRALSQSRAMVDVSAWGSIDGTNNFKDSRSPALGAIISRTVGDVVAVYVEPIWVNNTNPLPTALVDHNSTFFVGIGARVQIRPALYVVAEASPRAGGYKPGGTQGSFGIEKRVGGHLFQINFSNGFGTTMGQIARGSSGENDWYLGFNISRKFF